MYENRLLSLTEEDRLKTQTVFIWVVMSYVSEIYTGVWQGYVAYVVKVEMYNVWNWPGYTSRTGEMDQT
jgi:hypothetical protein